MSDNFINAEFVIEEEDLDKNIRIINSFEQYAKEKNFKIESSDKSVNEKEIKDNCKISINDVEVPFSYFHKFNEKGKFKIRYSFSQNLKKINYIFSGCEQLRNIDFSHFNTKNVSDMSYMLDDCCLLENINLANFDTQNVQDMSGMFMGCSSLINLNLSNFNTQNVKNMTSMFEGCSSLTNLNLSNFIIIQNGFIFQIPYYNSAIKMISYFPRYILSATNMKFMFRYCSSLRRENIIANDNRIFEQFFEDNN